MADVPDRGDLVWVTFTPQAGHEQAGRRPALALSPVNYNQRSGLCIFCPVTSQIKGYPFEVALPSELPISGVILTDQIRSLDWHARQSTFIAKAPPSIVNEVLAKLSILLGLK